MSHFARLIIALVGFSLAAPSMAQEYKSPSDATLKFYASRRKLSEPKVGLAKIKRLIKSIKTVENEDMGSRALSSSAYHKLSFNELFTYNMIHGENISQNCDAMPLLEDAPKLIFPYLDTVFPSDAYWSERQQAFFSKNRSRVIPLLRTLIRDESFIGVNVKQVICNLNAKELIPDLVAAYRKRKDHDLLTTLMAMMRSAEYKPLLSSEIGIQLYGPDASFQATVPANAKNQKAILDLALQYARQQ